MVELNRKAVRCLGGQMSKKSDRLGGAAEIVAAQARRLKRLRHLMTNFQVDAAEAAGCSQDSFSRMELGQTRIDTVALERFCRAYDVPAEYVITGRLAGFSDDLLRLVAMAEVTGEDPPPRHLTRAKVAPALVDTAAPKAPKSARKRPKTSNSDTPRKAAADSEAPNTETMTDPPALCLW